MTQNEDKPLEVAPTILKEHETLLLEVRLKNKPLEDLLRGTLLKKTKQQLIQKQIDLLTKLGNKANAEFDTKEQRVKGKEASFKKRKEFLTDMHAELKAQLDKTPPLKVLFNSICKRYPNEKWRLGSVKEWAAILNKGDKL